MADLTGPNPDEVQGPDARDAAVSGNPVLAGARASTAVPGAVSADNDAVDLWATRNGALNVVLRDVAGAVTQTTAAAMADGFANPTVAGDAAFASIFNGSTWDRLRAIAALDAAPNVDTGILAVGVGPGWDRKRDPVGIAANSTSNAVTVVVDGASTIRFHVTTIGVTPGSMIIQTSGDDTAWATAAIVVKSGTEQFVTGAFVPAVDDVYVVSTIGVRQVRFKVNAAYASGTVTVKWTASNSPQFVRVINVAPSTATHSNVSASATNVTALAANGARLGATVFNDSSSIAYLKLGATASATSFTVKMAAGAYYEVPFPGSVYSGIIDMIWVTATGSARVVEIT